MMRKAPSIRWARGRGAGPSRLSVCRRCRGSILILALVILIVLTSLALVLARTMRSQAAASANYLAQLQAQAVAQGALAYLQTTLDGTGGTLPDDSDLQTQAVAVGPGYFWLLKVDPDNDSTWNFGLTDEAGKINVNMNVGGAFSSSQFLNMLADLPNMTPDIAASIMDWRDADDNTTPGGAESAYYLALPTPYQAKNANFETLEELLMVKGMTPELLYGNDSNRNGMLDPADTDPDPGRVGQEIQVDHGLAPYLTVYSQERTPGRPRPGQPAVVTGLININSAPRAVLLCLPGLTDGDADAILARRQSGSPFTSLSDLASVISPAKASALSALITTRCFQCSTDIVAVDATGRSFKRYHVVLDLRSSPVTVLYWRDLTSLGWPLDPQILAALKAGQVPSASTGAPGMPASLMGVR